jgi:N,N'-diacetyllegionaminate synthase
MFLPLNKTLIIAEAGINHDGDLEAARLHIDAAVAAGADYVKFQSFVAEELVLPEAERSTYIIDGSHEGESFRDLLRRLELSREQQRDLANYCKTQGIKFLSTAFDLASLDFLCEEIGCDIIKVASADLTNLRFLRHCASKNLPIVLSSGMADLPEIDEALETLQQAGAEEICILHCVSWYPSEFEMVNLRAMHTIRERYGLPVGYSDHSLGTTLPSAAVAMGARCIEKHFTLDPTAFGPDHAASLSPAELIEMTTRIREVEAALGTGALGPQDILPIELSQRRVHRRSIVTTKAILEGETFTEHNLGIKRPGTGILPREFDNIRGKTARRDVQAEVLLEEDDIG